MVKNIEPPIESWLRLEPQPWVVGHRDFQTKEGFRSSVPRLTPSLTIGFDSYLRGIPEKTQSHSAFSRVFTSGTLDGHIGASLIRNDQAERIFESGDVGLFFERKFAAVSDKELLILNRDGEGSSLLLRNLRWTVDSYADHKYFVNSAIEHLVRWFEGNRVIAILYYYDYEQSDLLKTIFDSLSNRMHVKYCGNGLWMKYVLRGDFINAHYASDWHYRMLASPDYSGKRIASERNRLHGRILYEFDFDVEHAIRNSLLDWTFHPENRRCESLYAWRKQVALDMNINPTGKKAFDTLETIRKLLTVKPELMALY